MQRPSASVTLKGGMVNDGSLEVKGTELLRNRIEHAQITAIAKNLEIDMNALSGLSKRNVEDCHRQ